MKKKTGTKKGRLTFTGKIKNKIASPYSEEDRLDRTHTEMKNPALAGFSVSP